MKVEYPQAYRFILQDDIYLLENDKAIKHPISGSTTPAEATEPQNSPVTTIETPIQQIVQSIVTTDEPVFNYLGSNNQNFLILVNYPSDQHISTNHLTALENILTRKGFALADVAILNMHNYRSIKFAAMAAFFKPTRMVIMGKDALPDGIGNLALNKPMQGKRTHVLYSFSFDEMMSSSDNKRTFWENMKIL
ncbi:hypothetical protein ACFQZX_06045 [Mucilaginibacter litoreus]|uniref:Uncharacterized protein n=1 Tax=Mucilaginibacter litoreus TaxID=1048221 RepID=A0ABW3AQS1_9SPHI